MALASAISRFSPAREQAASESSAAPAGDARGLTVTVRNVHKTFGGKQVLKGVDLHIPAGQFVAVIGKSGCGKSTLLRLLVGLDRPTAGALSVGSGGPAVDTTRIMFQEPRLLPWARVLGNVEVGLRPEDRSSGEHARARALLEEVGLGDRAAEWPSVLSGGQRQRVALARALASRPRVMALDEPLGALDALTRIEMQKLLEAVWLSQGFTAILVTHDVSEALMLADRVVLLEEGRVALDLPVPLPRPRRRGTPEFGRLEAEILDKLLGQQANAEAAHV
jgi:sulfonate transport system ATP-binding protein